MNLLDTAQLDKNTIMTLFKKALAFKKTPWQPTFLLNKTIALLFFENTTRTHLSFELAAKRLGATTLNLNVNASSIQKGESILDTVTSIEAMGVNGFVIRHKDEQLFDTLSGCLKENTTIINAGTGTSNHPSQALLDAFTIYQHKKTFENLSIAIIGDIAHSRVAKSNITLLKTLGVKDLRLIGPNQFLPTEALGCQTFNCIEEGLKAVDIVMALRIQKERLSLNELPDEVAYFKKYGLTIKTLDSLCPHALVMHPGPVNHGIEIDAQVCTSKRSLIMQQIENGVFIRQAIFQWLLE